MVKLKGPSVSLDAAGSIGKTLVFANWKNRSYLKKHTKPKNPKTQLQTGSRAMIRFLSKQWHNLTQSMRDTFAEIAAAANTTPYHAYLKANQQRWTTGGFPAMEWPPAMSAEAGAMAFIANTVHGTRVSFSFYPQAAYYNWGIIAYRDRSKTFYPGIANAMSIDEWDCVDALHLDYGPLAPGTWWFRFNTFSYEGKPNLLHTTKYNVYIG